MQFNQFIMLPCKIGYDEYNIVGFFYKRGDF